MQFRTTPEEALAEARRVLSLEQVIHNLTGVPVSKKMACPFCQAKGKFGTFERNGNRLYKCFNLKGDCPATKTGDEVAFIALLHNLDRKQAFKSFLRLAGVAEL